MIILYYVEQVVSLSITLQFPLSLSLSLSLTHTHTHKNTNMQTQKTIKMSQRFDCNPLVPMGKILIHHNSRSTTKIDYKGHPYVKGEPN
jgi:hypothetical protein